MRCKRHGILPNDYVHGKGGAMKNDNHYLHDKECELCVLGTLLVERNAIHQVRELLTPNSFYFDFHREVYCAILAITDHGDRADIVSIMPELKNAKLSFNRMT